ncbi:MAG TPA: hypothetical protein VK474_00230 [Chthoniobacterales bacterium]|nr:hypothetical protein [Chthoniobacterales bacterium]
MRFLLGTVVAVAVIGGVVLHRQREEGAAPVQTVSAQPEKVVAPRAPHWPKSALDRANELKRQVATQRAEDGTK